MFYIRPGRPEDAAACADIHKRSWIYAYSHCVPMELIEQIHTGREAMWKNFLANESAAITLLWRRIGSSAF